MVNFLTNQARIDFQFSKCGKNVQGSTQTDTVTTEVRSPRLVVQKIVCGACFEPGEAISYAIVITNTGDTTACDIAVLEPLKKQTYLENSATLTIDGCPAPCRLKVGNIINEEGLCKKFGFKIGNLAAGSTAVINFETMPACGACEICNQVVVFFGPTSPCRKREAVVSNTTTTRKAFAKIEATKAVNKTCAACGDDLVYTITLTNCGNLKAHNVTITDRLPQGFSLNPYGVKVNGCKHKYTLNCDNLLTICGLTVAPKECNGNGRTVITLSGRLDCCPKRNQTNNQEITAEDFSNAPFDCENCINDFCQEQEFERTNDCNCRD